MTLGEARKTLEAYNRWLKSDENKDGPTNPNKNEVGDAIDAAISILPKCDCTQVSVMQRLSYIRDCLKKKKESFDPFSSRTREEPDVIWRHAVFCKLKQEGYSYQKIANASGYNHATVLWGVRNIRDGLSVNYQVIVKIWEELNQILIDCDER